MIFSEHIVITLMLFLLTSHAAGWTVKEAKNRNGNACLERGDLRITGEQWKSESEKNVKKKQHLGNGKVAGE